jgi:hypothetical protein
MQSRPRPVLVLNPATDGAFHTRTRELAEGSRTPAELQEALHVHYPEAVVRSRDLAGEDETWYVYRDGRWVPST